MTPVLAFDPREPQPDVYQEPQYLKFRAALSASEHISVLASHLRSVSMLFDGNLREPAKEVEPRYLKAAEMAVRYTSEEGRISAEHRAEEYAVNSFPELQARLRNCDSTEGVRRSLLIEWFRNANLVYVQSLKNGPVRSALEDELCERLEPKSGEN